MPHAGFVAFLAKGPIRGRAEPAEFRQTIRARLPGDARLGQDPSPSAPPERRYRKDFSQISRSISPRHGQGNRERVEIITHSPKRRCHVERSETSLEYSVVMIVPKLNRDFSPATAGSK